MRIPHVSGLIAAVLLVSVLSIPAQAQDFPQESDDFVQVNPTVPNDLLDFSDSNESCCAKDYAMNSAQYKAALATMTPKQKSQTEMAVNEFEANNPGYSDAQLPRFLIECEKYAQFPEAAASAAPGRRVGNGRMLPVEAYSMHVSNRLGAEYATHPNQKNIGHFHLEAGGGMGLVRLQDVKHYSVCMARGGNQAVAVNTDNGSIITYNGNDAITLAGNNTNMLTRTGDGEDIIRVHQAVAKDSATWTAHNIYKSALSGGNGIDTVEIVDTPHGTKWCHIGGYKIYGEYFYVVEFALPPSVTEGPRRQRMNIGKSVEYVVFKGRRYALQEFLNHGDPADEVARSVPLDAPLR